MLRGLFYCVMVLIFVSGSASEDRFSMKRTEEDGAREHPPNTDLWTEVEGQARWESTTNVPKLEATTFKALCDKPFPPEHGFIKGHNYSYMAVVRVGCEEGYVLQGPSNLTCLPVPFHGAPGIWVPQDEYRCVPKSTELLSSTVDTTSDEETFDDNESPYKDIKHRIQYFTERQKEFEDIRCPEPKAPINGEVIGTNFSILATVTYACDEYYILIGPSNATCLPVAVPSHHVATWEPPYPPSCITHTAPPCLLWPEEEEQTTGPGFDPRQKLASAGRLTDTVPNPKEIEGLPSLCALPAEHGPCRETIPRYFFDTTDLECRPFNYGGCHGNDNNFETFEVCQNTCR